MSKKLYRSYTHRLISGVCGGLAEYFGVNVLIFRIAFVLLIPTFGTGVLIYILLTLLIPADPNNPFNFFQGGSNQGGSPESDSTIDVDYTEVKN